MHRPLLDRRWSIFVALAAASCGFPKTAAAPTQMSPSVLAAAQARWPDATDESLAQGRKLFLARCNGCHGYPDLAEIAEPRWPEIMDEMGKKAGLNASQSELVKRYVIAARADLAPAKK